MEVTILREIDYKQAMAITTENLEHGGVFITVGSETPNTMTMGWAALGTVWHKPVLVGMVRKQRYTYDLLQKAGEFTVSVPTKNPLKEELIFAGTKSGRDYNKFEGHGLTAVPAQEVSAPIIKECGLHFECRTILVQDMTGDQMDEKLVKGVYKAGDYHTMFYGEILRCYTTDDE